MRTLPCALAPALAFLLVLSGSLCAEDAVPGQPNDPVAAKAYGVFDQACAGCHQTGRLKANHRPAGSLGNILDLGALAQNPALVTPGNADASPLYTSMQSRAMPLESIGEAAATEITATELAAVRDWIERLPAAPSCAERPRLAAQVVVEAVKKAVRDMGKARAFSARFVSLVPLANACASVDEIEGARQAVALLMNSLSFGLEPAKLTPLDPTGLILQIDLPAIGWTAGTWDRVARRAPASQFIVFDAATREVVGTDVPVVNGDWLADTATRAPFYYELMGMPDTLSALLVSLKIDLSDVKRGAADRTGIRTSSVARGNRLIERRGFANGAVWVSSEFAPTAARPDMFDMTIAAAATPSGTPAKQSAMLQADATLLHFDLPNGFPAFYAAGPGGARVNDLPLSVLKDDNHPATKITAAQSCFNCHGADHVGLTRGRADDLKARIAGEPSLTKETRERLLVLHSETSEMQRKIDEDRARYLKAAVAAGVEPLRLVNGLELLPALVARYRRDVTVGEVADLVDVEPKVLFELGKSGSLKLSNVVEHLAFGTVPRSEIDAVLPELAMRRGLRSDAEVSNIPASAGGVADIETLTMRLVLKADRATFQSGDLLTLTARTNMNCYLTILTVDARGRGTVLYPNEFEPNNFIEAERELRVPSDKAPYQFRLRDTGRETLIGICAATAKSVDGIHHDFEKQRFTELGDYQAFLNRNWGLRDPADSKPKVKAVRRTGEAAPAVNDGPVKPDGQARTAIRIMIE